MLQKEHVPKKFPSKTVFNSFTISLGIFFVSYQTAVFNPLGLFVQLAYRLTNLETRTTLSFLNCTPPFFAIFSALGSIYLMSKLGRKKTVLIANLVSTVGLGILAIKSLAVWFVGRALIGVGAGITMVYVPMYIAETVPPDRCRGHLNLVGILFTFGFLMIFALGLGDVEDPNGQAQWRVVILFAVVPNLLQLILWGKLLESPRYLVSKGKIDEARGVLTTIYHDYYGTNYEAPLVEQHIIKLVKEIEILGQKPHIRNWLRRFSGLQRHGIVIAVAQHMTGFTLVAFYSSAILSYNDIGFKDATIWTFFFGLLVFLSSLFSLAMEQEIPDTRAKKMLIAGLLIAVFLTLVVGIVYSSQAWVSGRILWLFLAIDYGILVQPPTFILLGDLLSLVGAAISVACAMVAVLIIIFPYLWLLNSEWGSSPHWFFFSFFCLLAAGYLYYYVDFIDNRPLADYLVRYDKYPNEKPKDASVVYQFSGRPVAAPPAPTELKKLESSSVPPTILYNL